MHSHLPVAQKLDAVEVEPVLYRRDLSSGPAPTVTIADSAAAELIERHAALRTGPTPSLSVAVFDRSGIVAARSAGVARAPGERPGITTVYRIASMSKSFCITAILLLAERGQVRLDDAVTTYVPEFHNYVDADGTEVPITLRMLMTNSSGLPEDNAWADSQIGISHHDFRALLDRGVRYGDEPGGFFQYSNLGFAVLGLVVENVTGRRFTHFAEEEILTPLGLHDTHFSADAYETDRALAVGYSTFDNGATWVERPYVGDGAMAAIGGLFSTLGDIARWSAWLSSAFCVDEMDAVLGLSAASRRMMQTAATVIHSDSRIERDSLVAAGYGMGLVVELDRELGVFAQHSGGLPGFSSHMRWHTDSGLGVVAFANTDGASLAAWSRELLADVVRGARVAVRRVPVWAETVAAAQRIDAMLRGGADYATCADLYSANVVSDAPLKVRQSQSVAVFAGLGGLSDETGDEVDAVADRFLWADSGSCLAWRLPCVQGDAIVQIEMTPLHDTAVQRITVETSAAGLATGMAAGFVPVASLRP